MRGPLRETRIRPRDVVLGLASAASLYLTFQIGDRFARRYVPSGERDIADIYTLRTLRPKPEIAARLATLIGPAEELFWRGYVQEGLMSAFGRWRGSAVAAMAYGGVHLVTGNFTLFGAAGIAGAHWCLLYARRHAHGCAHRQPRDLGRLDLPHPAHGRHDDPIGRGRLAAAAPAAALSSGHPQRASIWTMRSRTMRATRSVGSGCSGVNCTVPLAMTKPWSSSRWRSISSGLMGKSEQCALYAA